MTKALDAAIRAHCKASDEDHCPCLYPNCPCAFVAREGMRPALHAALPAEPPEWWQDWWDHFGFEEVGYSYRTAGWRALRAHLLGEDA